MLPNDQTTDSALQFARTALLIQQRSLTMLGEHLDASFIGAAELLAGQGKNITTGLGKSGFIARKMAATLNSLRMASMYIHPVDAMHGDSGVIQSRDVIVAFSKSGETTEVLRFVEAAMTMGARVVAIVSREGTSLSRMASFTLLAPAEAEFDTANILPTTSTTSSLVMSDLLAVCAANQAGNVVERLQQSHPGGAIGAMLLQTVDDVMHSGGSLPVTSPGTTMEAGLHILTSRGLGILCVVDDQGVLKGIITDGDVRRALERHGSSSVSMRVDDVMVTSPITVEQSTTLHQAMQIMERGSRSINVLPVLSGQRLVGVVRLHDLVRAQL